MKKNWLLIVVLFLLSVNLALVTTLLIRGYNSEKENEFRFRKGERCNRHMSFEEHLAVELSLSKDQCQRIKDFSSDFMEKKSFCRSQLDSIRDIYYSQLSKENPDTIILHHLANKLGKIKGDMILLDYQHYRNIRSICTPQQAIKFDSLGKIFLIERHKGDCGQPGRPPRYKEQNN